MDLNQEVFIEGTDWIIDFIWNKIEYYEDKMKDISYENMGEDN